MRDNHGQPVLLSYCNYLRKKCRGLASCTHSYVLSLLLYWSYSWCNDAKTRKISFVCRKYIRPQDKAMSFRFYE